MDNDNDAAAVAAAIDALPVAKWRGGYPELGLCVLDAIYSVNANYESTIAPMIGRFRTANHGADALGAAGLIALISDAGGPEAFAAQIGNLQRTSTRSGILKAAAAAHAAAVLVDHQIDRKSDLDAVVEHGELEAVEFAWRKVTGQRSGVTWRYFLMLTGMPGVKPDRMILRFLTTTLGRTVHRDEAVTLVTDAATRLGLDATAADHRIWSNVR
jgi:hypothetical protein